jgi:hypothetical protein
MVSRSRRICHQCTLSTRYHKVKSDICAQTSRQALNGVFVDHKATNSAELPFIFRYVPTLSSSTIDEAKSKQTVSLPLAVDAENMFRAVFLIYACVIGSLSLMGIWFLRLVVLPVFNVNLWISNTR